MSKRQRLEHCVLDPSQGQSFDMSRVGFDKFVKLIFESKLRGAALCDRATAVDTTAGVDVIAKSSDLVALGIEPNAAACSTDTEALSRTLSVKGWVKKTKSLVIAIASRRRPHMR